MALPISITENDKILILAPHPDDECIGVGGLLSKYSQLCDVIVMTDGRYGGNNTPPEEEWKIRKRQFENEMAYVQVPFYKWLGYEDGTLLNHKSCMDTIDFSAYTKIFLPWGEDNHTDHTATFMYAMEKIKLQKLTNVIVFQYEVHVPFHDITDYTDITSQIDEKVKLIQFHEEQVCTFNYDMLAKSLAKYRACQMNQYARYYETYVRTDIFQADLSDTFQQREKTLQKYKQFYRILTNWIKAKIDGKSICDYLIERKIQTITIYGYADIGKILYKELINSNIIISSILDRRAIDRTELQEVQVCIPEDGDKTSDAVMVTALVNYDDIKKELENMGYHNILLLSSVIEELVLINDRNSKGDREYESTKGIGNVSSSIS